jgi:2-C-methyl-D-erythritol 4-phosphate cytidylyltransferase
MPEPLSRIWAVLPAGGSGARMGANSPKQYLELGGITMLERSTRALLQAHWIERVVVVAAPGDARAADVLRGLERVTVAQCGGASRRDSVLAGLRYARDTFRVDGADWAMVHDAARPGLSVLALERLRAAATRSGSGALLALPVADTVKKATELPPKVQTTVDRQGLWLAQTPQMFRLNALIAALERHPEVTDESAAMEAEGAEIELVQGEFSNFKVTTPDDLAVMSRLLEGSR